MLEVASCLLSSTLLSSSTIVHFIFFHVVMSSQSAALLDVEFSFDISIVLVGLYTAVVVLVELYTAVHSCTLVVISVSVVTGSRCLGVVSVVCSDLVDVEVSDVGQFRDSAVDLFDETGSVE